MNSLPDMIRAIKQMMLVIATAKRAGLSGIRGEEFSYSLRSNTNGDVYISGDNCGELVLKIENIEGVASNFKILYLVAQKSAEYLEQVLKDYRDSKEILAPFILQEKLT